MRGTVKNVVPDRGFGFIANPEYPKGLFFHIRDTAPELPFDLTLTARDVAFEVVNTDGRPRAVGVRPAY